MSRCDVLCACFGMTRHASTCLGMFRRIREHDEASNLINGKFMTGCEELPAYDLGVNVLVYALTQDGSLAQRLVAAE